MKTSLRAKLPDRQSFRQLAGCLAVAVAVSLPWSTSATSILIVLWVLALLPTLDVSALRREFVSAAGGLPVLLWVLAVVGMLWAAVPWARGSTALAAFSASRHSAAAGAIPQFRPRHVRAAGISSLRHMPPRNVVGLCARRRHHTGEIPRSAGQGLHFSERHFPDLRLCASRRGLRFWRARKGWIAVALVVLAALFFADIAFVAASRTALLVAPLLAVALGYREFGLKGVAAAVVIARSPVRCGLNRLTCARGSPIR
jgi:O-antigen ligase